MAKGIKLDEETKEAIRADVRNMGKSGETKKAIAARHGVHPTMISKVMNSHKAPKRKTAKRAVKAKPTEAQWQAAFDEYIKHRDAAKFWAEEAEASRKKLQKIAKGLK